MRVDLSSKNFVSRGLFPIPSLEEGGHKWKEEERIFIFFPFYPSPPPIMAWGGKRKGGNGVERGVIVWEGAPLQSGGFVNLGKKKCRTAENLVSFFVIGKKKVVQHTLSNLTALPLGSTDGPPTNKLKRPSSSSSFSTPPYPILFPFSFLFPFLLSSSPPSMPGEFVMEIAYSGHDGASPRKRKRRKHSLFRIQIYQRSVA